MKKGLFHIVLGVGAAALATVSASSAEAFPSYIMSSHEWSQGMAAIDLGPADGVFCYLTGVTGRFRGTGESVNVLVSDSDNHWYLGGTSQQNGVAATAACLNEGFLRPEPGGVNNFTAWWDLYAIPRPIPYNCNPYGCPVLGGFNATDAWQGDAALMITGIVGEFNGLGEMVTAGQANGPWGYHVFEVTAGSDNGAGGFARSLFVGVPQSGFNPSFYGPGGGPATASVAGTYFLVSFGAGASWLPMAPTSAAFCYFTAIGGAFAGPGEQVYIVPWMFGDVEYWVLWVASEQSNGTFAEAQCYALDQSVSR
jgi:hypothetical protein